MFTPRAACSVISVSLRDLRSRWESSKAVEGIIPPTACWPIVFITGGDCYAQGNLFESPLQHMWGAWFSTVHIFIWYMHWCGDVGFFLDKRSLCALSAQMWTSCRFALWDINKQKLWDVTFWSWRALSSRGLDLDMRPAALTVLSLKLRISVRWVRCFSLCLLQSVNTFLNRTMSFPGLRLQEVSEAYEKSKTLKKSSLVCDRFLEMYFVYSWWFYIIFNCNIP